MPQILERVIGYSNSFARVKTLIAHNSGICQGIVASSLATYGLDQDELNDHIQARRSNERKVDRGAVSQALKHLVRDWAPEGDQERNSTFPLILDTMLEHFASTSSRGQVQVLVPGAGLGRLAHEIAALGRKQGFQKWNLRCKLADVDPFSASECYGKRVLNARQSSLSLP